MKVSERPVWTRALPLWGICAKINATLVLNGCQGTVLQNILPEVASVHLFLPELFFFF